MATLTPNTKEEQDSSYSPESLSKREGINGYNRSSDGLDDHPISGGDSSGLDPTVGVRKAEENPEWKNAVTPKLPSTKKSGFFASPKRKGPLIGFVLALLLGTGGAGFFIAPVLGPITFFENVTDDLNDQLSAMEIRGGYLFRNKLPSSERKVALTGCTKLSIRCKFASVNDKQIAKLKEAGITVQGEKGGPFGIRTQPTGYSFQGKDFTPEQWSAELKSNSSAQYAQRRANNMKYLGMSDTAFTRVLKRFGISKKPPELTGSVKDRVNALLAKANTSEVASLKFSATADGDDGEPRYTLDGDTKSPPSIYSEAQKLKLEASISRVANAKPPSKIAKASIGAFSVLGYWDLACSVKNMIGAASVASKVANQAELIKYAMPLASLSGQMKAGEISVEDAEALGEFFSQTDSRKSINNLTGSVTATSGDENVGSTVSDEVGTIDNPDYGKSLMDSELYKMSSNGGVASASVGRTSVSLGMGQNQLLGGISGFSNIANVITNLGDTNACAIVQSFGVRTLGIIAGVGAAIGSGGGSAIGQGIIAAGMMTAMVVMDSVVNNALSGSLLENAELADATVVRGDGLWTGMSGLLGASAQQRGLVPGSSSQIVEYAQLQNQTKQDYIALEREDTNQLDIKNQYSFVGSLARSVAGYSTSSSFNAGSVLSNISSIVGGGLGTFANISSAYAAPIDQARFEQCDDENYQKIGIDADVQCNIRYIMPSEDLALDTDEVAVYMEQNGFVEQDTTTGFPAGYTPPEPAESQNAVTGFVSGTVDSFVNTRDLKGNEYAMFLDYCAYRTMPFGETFEESGALNDDPAEWKTGEKCMERNSNVSKFRIYTLDKSLQDAEDRAEPEQYTAATTVAASGKAVLPVDPGYGISDSFNDPNYTATKPHKGIDISNYAGGSTGKPVYAVRDGEVIESGFGGSCNSNNTVVIQHIDGTRTGYMHMLGSDITVKKGSKVTAGQQIGKINNCGDSSGAHLHFEVSPGTSTEAWVAALPEVTKYSAVWLDPVAYLAHFGVSL